LQKRGVRSYLVITDAFRPMVMAQAKARGIENPRLIIVKHPIGGLNPDELVSRIDQAEKSFFDGLEKAAE
jgi:hypothetical protein